MISTEELLMLFRQACVTIGQNKVAKQLGLSTQYINDMYHARRPIGHAAAEWLGYRQRCMYEPLEDDSRPV